MIIKSKRTKAKGAALKRLLRHVVDGEDNDAVELVQGNVADLEDARADALRFGREYSVRHWILAPEVEISPTQLAYLIALLAVEFGFDPKLAVAWKHFKPREGGACDQHYHLLVREVNAITGGVMTSSHNFRVHEKLSRQVEIAWGHRLTRGAHNRAVAAALTGGENANVVTAMTDAGLLDGAKPVESFGEDEHQRTKRDGLDLPRLRIMISEALSKSKSRDEFVTRLETVGLRIRLGEKADTPIVETLDNILVGSLARLIGLRKKALEERMKFNGSSSATTIVGPQEAATRSAATADQPPLGNPSVAPVADCQNDARRGNGEPIQRGGPTGSVPHGGSPASASDRRDGSDTEQAGSTRIPNGRSRNYQSGDVDRARLVLALGCVEKQNELLDLLGVARRCALSPIERVIGDLDESIEKGNTLIDRVFVVPEPASLVAARQIAAISREDVRKLEAKESATLQKLAALPVATLWRRLWYRREAKQRSTLNVHLVQLSASLRRAESVDASAQRKLVEEQKAFQVARIKRETEAERETERARRAVPIASAAKLLVLKNPQFAVWGSARLIEMAAKIENEKALVLDHDVTEGETYSLRG
jgi:hypothetical protein